MFHLYPVSMAWTLGGVAGIIIRTLLFQKFKGDLLHFTLKGVYTIADYRDFTWRNLEESILHLLVKSGVAVIGIWSMFQANEPMLTLGSGILITFPWILSLDALRKYQSQIKALRRRERMP